MQYFVPLFPNYLQVDTRHLSDELNGRLVEIGREYFDNHRKPGSWYSQQRDNVFVLYPNELALRRLASEATDMARRFISDGWGVDYARDFHIEGQVFVANRDNGGVAGVASHVHNRSHLTCTYWPKVAIDADAPRGQRGEFRLFDPCSHGTPPWGGTPGWYDVPVETGTMIMFQSSTPHGSAMFVGEERICFVVDMKVEHNDNYWVKAREVGND